MTILIRKYVLGNVYEYRKIIILFRFYQTIIYEGYPPYLGSKPQKMGYMSYETLKN
jgi:hypothetical protein